MGQNRLIENLKNDFTDGHVIVIIGAGISIASCQDQIVDGFHVARWQGLLKHGIRQCRDIENILNKEEAAPINAMIDIGRNDFLINAASLITQCLQKKSQGSFHRWLKDSIGQLKPTNPEIIETIDKWQIPIVTLNYDDLIERITNRIPVTWNERAKVEDIIRYKKIDSVFHLHGYFEKPDSIVLGLASYNEISKDRLTETILRALTLNHTLLFIGCDGTFQDPNFSRLIEWGHEALQESTHKHYVLCKKTNKKYLSSILKEAPWIIPIEYGTNYDNLLPFLQSLKPSSVCEKKSDIDFSADACEQLVSYAKVIKKTFSKLPLESLDSTGIYYRDLDLWQVFIPQNVREVKDYLPKLLELPKEYLQQLRHNGQLENFEFDPNKIDELNKRYLQQPSQKIFERIDDVKTPRLVILGDPGSGKSSLIQAYALRWADQSINEWHNKEIPLIIELRKYSQQKRINQVKDFIDFIHKGFGIPYSIDKKNIEIWLNNGQVRFFFDGLDEIFDPVLREDVVNSIQKFSNQYPSAKIVVTSRVIGYKGEQFLNASFCQFMLQDLDDEQIKTFLEKWYTKTSSPHENIESDAKLKRLICSIEDSQHIRELAGNPLLLTMMAILNRYRDLPRDRAELYKECSKLLLQQWKVEEALKEDPDIASDALAIGFSEKEIILRRLAREMQMQSKSALGNIISEEHLEIIIEEIIKSHVKGNPHVIARALIKHLRERNFILCYIGGGSYAFIHRTFLEYYCAEDIKLRFEHEKSITFDYLKKKVFGAHWDDESWNEVLLLLAGTIHSKSMEDILVFLINQEDFKQTYNHILLAARCIGEVRKKTDLGEISETIKLQISDLVNLGVFETDFDYDDYTKYYNLREQAFQLRIKIWHDDPKTEDWIKKCIFLSKNNVGSLALTEYVKRRKNDPNIIVFLKSLISQKKTSNVYETAIPLLGEMSQENPEIFSLFKRYAIHNKNTDVRYLIIDELATRYNDNDEVYSIIKKIACTDKDSEVRQGAIWHLGTEWKDNPETIFLLKKIGKSIEDSEIRRTAIRLLARHWREDSETLGLIKNHAKYDKNHYAREFALELLNDYWKEDPNTYQIIKNSMESDKSEYVRSHATFMLVNGWEVNLEIKELLKKIADSHKDGYMRNLAINVLTNKWPDDPETFQLLKKFISSNTEIFWRNEAIKSLVKKWKNYPGTLPLLKTIALSRKKPTLRNTALREIAQGWRASPDTLLFLKNFLRNEGNSEVRKVATYELACGWSDQPAIRTFLRSLKEKN